MTANEDKLIKIIRDLYDKGDKETVIDRAKISIEAGLVSGLNSGFMVRSMIDIGIKPEEVGIGMMQAILKVPDSKLNDTDKIVKKEATRIYGNILVDVVKQALKEKKENKN